MDITMLICLVLAEQIFYAHMKFKISIWYKALNKQNMHFSIWKPIRYLTNTIPIRYCVGHPVHCTIWVVKTWYTGSQSTDGGKDQEDYNDDNNNNNCWKGRKEVEIVWGEERVMDEKKYLQSEKKWMKHFQYQQSLSIPTSRYLTRPALTDINTSLTFGFFHLILPDSLLKCEELWAFKPKTSTTGAYVYSIETIFNF